MGQNADIDTINRPNKRLSGALSLRCNISFPQGNFKNEGFKRHVPHQHS